LSGLEFFFSSAASARDRAFSRAGCQFSEPVCAPRSLILRRAVTTHDQKLITTRMIMLLQPALRGICACLQCEGATVPRRSIAAARDVDSAPVDEKFA
jgi:hypothetical protein